jgi:predicted nucleotidyltransferase
VRLAEKEQSAIREVIRDAYAEASICLFGSCADDAVKGGDIDLLVRSKKIALIVRLGILAQFHQRLGWARARPTLLSIRMIRDLFPEWSCKRGCAYDAVEN